MTTNALFAVFEDFNEPHDDPAPPPAEDDDFECTGRADHQAPEVDGECVLELRASRHECAPLHRRATCREEQRKCACDDRRIVLPVRDRLTEVVGGELCRLDVPVGRDVLNPFRHPAMQVATVPSSSSILRPPLSGRSRSWSPSRKTARPTGQ